MAAITVAEQQGAAAAAARAGPGGTKGGAAAAVEVEPPSKRVLMHAALASCIPFIGFGLVDNAVMIVAGDFIETQMLKVSQGGVRGCC